MPLPLRPLSKENDPNPWDPGCREPSRYHIRAAGTTEAEVGDFLWGLVRVLQPRFVVETGTADGDTTERIGAALAANGAGQCFSIEIGSSRAQRAAKRLRDLPVTVLCGNSLAFDWSTVLPPEPQVDFVFIDGGAERVNEFLRLKPYLAPGAFVAFHDTGNGLKVSEDVQSMIAREEHLLSSIHIPCPRGLTIGRMP